MALTLAEAKVGMADHIDQQIVDTLRRESRLLDLITFDNSVSPGTGGSTLTYGYLQILTPSTAGIRKINAEYTPSEAKKDKKSANCAIMGGSFEIDRVIAQTSGASDEVAFQIEQKTKAVANMFSYKFINAVKETDEFDGLNKLLSGTANEVQSAVDLSTATNRNTNYQAGIDELDELEALMDEKPTLWLMNKKTKARYTGIARRAGYLTHGEDAFGRKLDYINGIEVYEVEKYYDGSSSVEIIPDGDIYGVVLSLTGAHAFSPTGTNMVTKCLPDFKEAKAVHKGDVELVAGVALKSTLKAVHLKAYSA